MIREKWEGYNEIQAFGLSVVNKEKKELKRFKNIGACRPLFLVFENTSKLAIEKARDL